MAKPPPRVLWDSCVIIDAIQATPGRIELIQPFLDEAENGRLDIVVSEVSVAEVKHLHKLEESKGTEEIIRMIKEWFDSPYIIRRNVHPGISETAASIGRVHRIKRAADAIVIATAVEEDVDQIHTFDGDGKKRKSGLLRLDGKIGTPPVSITVPDPSRGTLWYEDD